MKIKLNTDQFFEQSFLEKVIEGHKKPKKKEEDVKQDLLDHLSNLYPPEPKETPEK